MPLPRDKFGIVVQYMPLEKDRSFDTLAGTNTVVATPEYDLIEFYTACTVKVDDEAAYAPVAPGIYCITTAQSITIAETNVKYRLA